jgi:DNA replication initiation complex subunit (GINS family)
MVLIAQVYYNKVTREAHTSYENSFDKLDSTAQLDILTETIQMLIREQQELIRRLGEKNE